MSAIPPNDAPARPEAALNPRGGMSFGLLFRLGVADLWHERMLTLCVVVALTAVLAPLLILFSLKYGLVETLRTRLVNDPRNREIRPELGHTFTHVDVQELEAFAGVRFIVPNTRTISASVEISLSADGKNSLHADVVPTGPGDPLLVDNSAPIPESGSCVLSYRAWKSLVPNGGMPERIHIIVGRAAGDDKREEEITALTVAGVADERTTSHAAIFTPLEFLERVESWRDGYAVPSLGWAGGTPEASGVTDRVIVAMSRPMDAVERSTVPVRAPWVTDVNEVASQQLETMQRLAPDYSHFYEMATSSKRIDAGADEKAILALRRSLPDDAGPIFAQCRPLALDVLLPGREEYQGVPFDVDPLLVNEPVRRRPFNQPKPSKATDTTQTAAAPSTAPQPPNTAAAEATIPKAIPVAPALPPLLTLPGQPPPPTPHFDLSRFQKQLARPPPSEAAPKSAPQPGGRDAPRSPPSTPKGRHRVPSAGVFLLPDEIGDADARWFRYIATNTAKKDTTPATKKRTSDPAKTALPAEGTIATPANKTPDASPGNGAAQPPVAPGTNAIEVRTASPAEPPPPAPTPLQSPPDPKLELISPSVSKPIPDALPSVTKREAEPPPRPLEKPRRELTLPDSPGVTDGTLAQVTYASAYGPITFPAVIKTGPGPSPVIPQSLAGVLRLGLDRGVQFDPSSGQFVLSRRGYPTVRIVAETIDDVERIASHLNSRGISVSTAAARIRDVRELDRYTSYVFLLVAGVGLTGAVGSLLASLIASVERKRRSLGVLRLLGLRRRTLFRLPFYQSAIVVSLSVGLAVIAWRYVSKVILQVTAASNYLQGDSIQTLPVSYLWAAWGGALLVAAAASFVAGLRVMRVDPSEAIRDE